MLRNSQKLRRLKRQIKPFSVKMRIRPSIKELLQVEALVELWRPAVVLGLRLELSLLVGEVRPNHGDLHEGSEHAGRLPL